jgi:multicomponent Na+:H+ antiporter subunit B
MNEGKFQGYVIERAIAKLLIPFIQLYGIYIIVHGKIAPGGGFQGGVIIGASVILYVIVFGMEEGRKWVSQKVSDILNSTGVLLFGGIGLLCILAGGMYLEYTKLSEANPILASKLGIYGIEIGIGITVAAVMIILFFDTARRKDD